MKKIFSLLSLVLFSLLLIALYAGNSSDPSLNVATDADVLNIFGHNGAIFADVIFQSIGFFSGFVFLISLCYASLLILFRNHYSWIFLILSLLLVPAFSFVGMSMLGEHNIVTEIFVNLGWDSENKSTTALILLFSCMLFLFHPVISLLRRAKKSAPSQKKVPPNEKAYAGTLARKRPGRSPSPLWDKNNASSKKNSDKPPPQHAHIAKHYSREDLHTNLKNLCVEGNKARDVNHVVPQFGSSNAEKYDANPPQENVHKPSSEISSQQFLERTPQDDHEESLTPEHQQHMLNDVKSPAPSSAALPYVPSVSAAPASVPISAEDASEKALPFVTSHIPSSQPFDVPPLFSSQNIHISPCEDLENPEGKNPIEDTLSEFGAPGTVIRATRGPLVTLYEVRPERAVKASKIISLSDELALSLRKSGVRTSVIPERDVIGLEVPNEKNDIVPFGSIINSSVFKTTEMDLPIALGVDISGDPRLMDLSKAPHLLIAGTTGSGKSIGLHSLIVSLLLHHPWWKCRFMMVDPKILELAVYNDIPHLLSPVINDTDKAVGALDWLVNEMESRYHAIAKAGARNISSYNSLSDTMNHSPFPFIVVIIDEMADLMLNSGKEIEIKIQRLAQMARAAGIHLVMATQRPSVDVVTGVIKANFPARIAFRVNSKIDSRTILGGESGAEVLIGNGDMLAMAANGITERLHGAFISEDEVMKVVTWAKSQAKPQYIEKILQRNNHEDASSSGDEEAEGLFAQAVQIIRSNGKASTSYLQRKMQIGYNKAARLIDKMEEEGIISPADKVGRRTIF